MRFSSSLFFYSMIHDGELNYFYFYFYCIYLFWLLFGLECLGGRRQKGQKGSQNGPNKDAATDQTGIVAGSNPSKASAPSLN